MTLKILEDKENTNFFKISKSSKLQKELTNLRIHLSSAKMIPYRAI